MCLPSSSSLPLTAAVFIGTFLLHFKAPRRLMSYPEIMKGETLLGFETGAEHVSSSQFSHLPSSRVEGTSQQHFHLGGSGTGRSFDSTRCFSFFLFISQEEKSLITPFEPIKKVHIPFLSPVCGYLSQIIAATAAVPPGFSHLLVFWNSLLKLCSFHLVLCHFIYLP